MLEGVEPRASGAAQVGPEHSLFSELREHHNVGSLSAGLCHEPETQCHFCNARNHSSSIPSEPILPKKNRFRPSWNAPAFIQSYWFVTRTRKTISRFQVA